MSGYLNIYDINLEFGFRVKNHHLLKAVSFVKHHPQVMLSDPLSSFLLTCSLKYNGSRN